MSDNKNVVSEVLKIFKNGWNKQVILYGPPGTSKTYSSTIIAAAMLAGVGDNGEYSDDMIRKKLDPNNSKQGESLYCLASEYLKDKGNYKLVQFHPSYSYEDFVRGITVKLVKDSVGNSTNQVTYEVESKIIEKFCKENGEGTKVLVIDEINRAPLASVLGELIYGLEYRNEKITTSYELKDEDGKISDLVIPDDLYIIGTMNTADRSIGSMDYAVRRRFAFIQVGSEASAIKGSWRNEEDGKSALDLYEKLMNSDTGIFAEAYKEDTELDIDDIKIGHTYFLGKEDQGQDYLEYRVKYQIFPIYQEYVKDGIIKKQGIDEFVKIVNEHFEKEIIKLSK